MMFKNLSMYRLPANYRWAITSDELHMLLAQHAFVPCTSSEAQRSGWAEPRPGESTHPLVHTVQGQMLIMLRTEEKILPAASVAEVAKVRALELEASQGFYPGKKAMKELKERAFDELLPRALSRHSNVYAWIDLKNGWLAIDAASAGKADHVLKCLLKSIDRMPVESLRVQRSPVGMMTAWLESDEAPVGFTVDRDCELRATGETKAAVRFVNHTLDVDDIRRHIAQGKQCTKLALTWRDKISFVLDETLTLKKVTPLDTIRETDATTRNDTERFDNDFFLMSAEYNAMLFDLVLALGGFADATPAVQDNADIVDAAFTPSDTPTPHYEGDGPDPLYSQALQITLSHRRASIPLVQRHLRIGYNRAARLLEAMEHAGVIGPMQSNGGRDILTTAAAA